MKRKADQKTDAPAKKTQPAERKLAQHMSKEPRLKDKVCVISGASRGFGQGIAVRFVEEGAKVALLARGSCDETLALIGQIEGVGDVSKVAQAFSCDLDSEKSMETTIAAVVSKFGPEIHVLINNAARFNFFSVETASAKDWDEICGTNIKGTALLTKHVLPAMKKAGGGSIVFQGSISSFSAQPDCVTYSCTKAAIVQMAKNCAYDLAKYNIRCNTVCAGTVETPISEQERKDHGWSVEEWTKLKIKDVMLQRIGTVREVADATLFFACDESSYCTGTELMVDGGQRSCTVMKTE